MVRIYKIIHLFNLQLEKETDSEIEKEVQKELVAKEYPLCNKHRKD